MSKPGTDSLTQPKTTKNPDHVLTPVRALFDGPLDIVGDVHGEYESLCTLLDNLGYSAGGSEHPDGRRLVFVGDLVDRGPMNVSVVNLVRGLVEAGQAQCILGNHELNLLRAQRKDGNPWFHGEREDDGHLAFDEVLGSDAERQELLGFLDGLPLALEREDLRVVHACWDQPSIDAVRGRPAKVIDLFREYEHGLGQEISRTPPADRIEQQLIFQNRNPVKVLTSGFESRHAGFMHNGRLRHNQRVTWWNDYAGDQPFCVFGHYNRLNVPDNEAYIFEPDDRPHEPLGSARNCTCIDLGGGWRPKERRAGVTDGFKSRLTALRWPERKLIAD